MRRQFEFVMLCHVMSCQVWINALAGGVTMDVLDTVELMDLLFDEDAKELPSELINAIMVIRKNRYGWTDSRSNKYSTASL